MADVKSWSTSAGSNNSSPPDGAPEGWYPNQINDTVREIMAALRRWYEDAQWVDLGVTPTYASSTTFTLAGDYSSAFHVKRRLKASATATVYGRITDVTYDGVSTTTVTLQADSGSLTNSLSSVALAALTADNHSLPYKPVPLESVASDVSLTGANNNQRIGWNSTKSQWVPVDAASVPAGSVPSGTAMLFYQASAPTGWTQDTTHNDKAVRVVNTAGGTAGGSTAFSSILTSRTPTGSITVNGHSLTEAEIAGHSHSVSITTSSNGAHEHGAKNLMADSDGDHQHNAGSLTMAAAGGHTHTLHIFTADNTTNHTHYFSSTSSTAGAHYHDAYVLSGTGSGHGPADATGISVTGAIATSTNGDHAHTVTGNTQGQSTAHNHSLSGTTSSAPGHIHAISNQVAAGGAHTHTVSGSVSSAGAHTHSVTGNTGTTGSGSAHSHTGSFTGVAMDFAVQYLDVIVCVKD